MNTAYLKSAGVAALSSMVLFTGCGQINSDATLVKIKAEDGSSDTISLGYANFVARYNQAMYDQYFLSYYGEDMWKNDMTGSGKNFQEDTKEGILEDLENQYVAKAHAADYNVKLSDEQNTAIADAVKAFMSDNSEETLEVMGAKEEYVKQYLEDRTIYSLVSAAAKEAADPDIKDEDCWMRTFSYVLFDTTGKQDENGNVVEYTDDEITDFKAQAKKLSQSEDFDAEVESLGLTKSSYSYLKGEKEDDTMDMSIIEAAEKLAEGDVSSVIDVDGVGYYVLRLDADHDEDASQTKRESLQSDAFNKLLDSWKEAIEWKVDDKAWAKVKFDSLFKVIEKESDEADSAESTEATESTEETEATETTEEAPTEETEETEAESTTEETTEESTDETEATTESTTEGSAEESDAN